MFPTNCTNLSLLISISLYKLQLQAMYVFYTGFRKSICHHLVKRNHFITVFEKPILPAKDKLFFFQLLSFKKIRSTKYWKSFFLSFLPLIGTPRYLPKLLVTPCRERCINFICMLLGTILEHNTLVYSWLTSYPNML